MKLTRRSVWRTALATPLALAGFSSTRSSAEGRVQLAQATAPGPTNARDPRINDRSTRSAGVRKVASRAEPKALEPASHGGNVFDGRVSTSMGLIINSVTNATFSGNRVAMSEGRPARPCVIMQGNCSGTIYEVSNANATTRIGNTSSGTVHNRASSPSDDGETRQDGDVIWNSDLANGGPLAWVRARGAWGAPHGGAR